MLPLLPIIAGLALGATSVIAYNNRKVLKEKALEAKDSAVDTAKTLKETVTAKAESLLQSKGSDDA